MNLLQVHNYYQQPGGEDRVFAAEGALLERMGNKVVRYTVHNDEIRKINKVALAVKTIWNVHEHRKLQELIQREQPDVVHIHNTLPLISPAVYYAAKQQRVAVVQTMHNYRYTCANATLYRDNRICEDCLGKTVAFPGIIHSCYRGSRAATSIVVAMSAIHKFVGTFRRQVDAYIALTDFSRNKLISAGLPPEKIFVKPNFIDLFSEGSRSEDERYALFVGRLSPEKGVGTLLKGWSKQPHLQLKIVGDGPLYQMVSKVIGETKIKNVALLGHRPSDEVLVLMRGCRFLVFPSEWYEGFPMTIIEAFACGVPIIASRLGGMQEIVEEGRTGLLFNPGDPDDLAAKVEWAWNHPHEILEMGENARREYEFKYTAERNYNMLMEIYRIAIERSKSRTAKLLN